MQPETQEDPKINRNADLNLSAYLLFCGFEFIGIELPAQSTGRFAWKTTFMFKYSIVMKQKKNEYFGGLALVEPKGFCNQRMFLRHRIQELQAKLNGE